MFKTIEMLREISRRCLSGEALDADLSSWLGTSLDDFLTHRETSVDDAMGLKFPRGGIPWWQEEAIRKRDDALRQLAFVYFPELTPSARATEIRTLSVRYAGSAWRHDQKHWQMPPHYRGMVKECLWLAFSSGAAMPISERQLRTILGQ